ncbi:hypothetical protein BC939DRAFT_506764 [Gamsiella multidivaricata]|uniref:uncharacterized protein n=1 Tax=Gamsiella multidivaricata TaxID=101098 RepID=UPI00221FF247|nr:uncharacterized protein BC939DRAFT_506764 [Gamsiella multidivaricata]KAI7818131.1 hypothetical protein BC939DRAFT_506764 [Gamsiella multidivaricata]
MMFSLRVVVVDNASDMTKIAEQLRPHSVKISGIKGVTNVDGEAQPRVDILNLKYPVEREVIRTSLSHRLAADRTWSTSDRVFGSVPDRYNVVAHVVPIYESYSSSQNGIPANIGNAYLTWHLMTLIIESSFHFTTFEREAACDIKGRLRSIRLDLDKTMRAYISTGESVSKVDERVHLEIPGNIVFTGRSTLSPIACRKTPPLFFQARPKSKLLLPQSPDSLLEQAARR